MVILKSGVNKHVQQSIPNSLHVLIHIDGYIKEWRDQTCTTKHTKFTTCMSRFYNNLQKVQIISNVKPCVHAQNLAGVLFDKLAQHKYQ